MWCIIIYIRIYISDSTVLLFPDRATEVLRGRRVPEGLEGGVAPQAGGGPADPSESEDQRSSIVLPC